MQDFRFYFGLGWDHILTWGALDHLLFITALAAIYTLRDWKQVLVLVTAFTIGHSLTLALSVFDVIRFNEKWVEFLIPCTIVITAITNLFQKKFTPRTIRINYALALGFGLIHGMGFANTIRFLLADDQQLGWSLLWFNLGLEAGQIIVVTVILAVCLVAVDMLKINRREWVIFISGAVCSLGLQMAIERIPIKKKSNDETTSILPVPARKHPGDDRAEYAEQSLFGTCQQV